jgi:hypothetical protein
MLNYIVFFLTSTCVIGTIVLLYFTVLYVKDIYLIEQKKSKTPIKPKMSKRVFRGTMENSLIKIFPEYFSMPFIPDMFEECVDSLYLVGKYSISSKYYNIFNENKFNENKIGTSEKDYPETIKLTIGTFDAISSLNESQDIENQIIEHIKIYNPYLSEDKMISFVKEIKIQLVNEKNINI